MAFWLSNKPDDVVGASIARKKTRLASWGGGRDIGGSFHQNHDPEWDGNTAALSA